MLIRTAILGALFIGSSTLISGGTLPVTKNTDADSISNQHSGYYQNIYLRHKSERAMNKKLIELQERRNDSLEALQ